MDAAFFTGMLTGMVIILLVVFLLVFVLKNAVFLVNCDDDLTDKVHHTVAMYESEQYDSNMTA